jgi:hypothetical protein
MLYCSTVIGISIASNILSKIVNMNYYKFLGHLIFFYRKMGASSHISISIHV